jgi:hypothetical protein
VSGGVWRRIAGFGGGVNSSGTLNGALFSRARPIEIWEMQPFDVSGKSRLHTLPSKINDIDTKQHENQISRETIGHRYPLTL